MRRDAFLIHNLYAMHGGMLDVQHYTQCIVTPATTAFDDTILPCVCLAADH